MKITTWGPAKFVIHWFPGPVESFKLSSPALLHRVTGRSLSLPCTPGTVRLLASAVQWRKRVPQYMLNVAESLHVFLLLWWLIEGGYFVVVEFFSLLLLRVGVLLLLGFSLSCCGWVFFDCCCCFLALLGFSLLLWIGVLPLLSFFSPSILGGCFVVVGFFPLLLLWVGVLSLLSLFLSFYFGWVFCHCWVFSSPIVDGCFVVIGLFSPTISTVAAVHLQQRVYTNKTNKKYSSSKNVSFNNNRRFPVNSFIP